jgi:hypothetical protein
MIQTIEKFISEIKRVLAFSLMPKQLVLTRISEKFDVVERVPHSIRIKM